MNDMRKMTALGAQAAGGGDPHDAADAMARASAMLMDQAVTLDGMFADLAQCAADRLVEWPGAAQAYVRLALRAQSNCRASLATLAKASHAARQDADAE